MPYLLVCVYEYEYLLNATARTITAGFSYWEYICMHIYLQICLCVFTFCVNESIRTCSFGEPSGLLPQLGRECSVKGC